MKKVVLLTTLLTLLTSALAQKAQVTLNVAGWKGGRDEVANIPELNAKFMKENPDVKVVYDYLPKNNYDSTMNTRLSGGDAPDVLMVDKSIMNRWGGAGYLADLSKEAWVKTLTPQIQNYSRSADNKTQMFVMEMVGLGMFVNLDLLKQAGVSQPPTTWPEFTSALAKLKAKGITPLLIPDKGTWTAGMVAEQLAANLVYRNNPNYNTLLTTGKTKFYPAWKPVVERIKQLATSGYFDPKLNVGIDEWSQGLDQFSSGKVAFLPQGAWNISSFQKIQGLNFAFTPLAGGNAGSKPIGVVFAGTSWAINSKSQVDSAARRYVAFWAKNENLSRFLEGDGAFSPLKGGTSGMPKLAALFTEANDAGRILLSPSGGVWPEAIAKNVNEAMANSLQALFLNIDTKSEDVIASWDAALKAALQK